MLNTKTIMNSWHTYYVGKSHEQALRSVYKYADEHGGKIDLFLLDPKGIKRKFTIDIKRIDEHQIWDYAIHHLQAYADCMLKQIEEQMEEVEVVS